MLDPPDTGDEVVTEIAGAAEEVRTVVIDFSVGSSIFKSYVVPT